MSPRSGEGVVVEAIVEPTLHYLDQDVCKGFVHVPVLVWLLLGNVTG